MQRGQIVPKDRDIPHKKFLVRVYVGRDEAGKRKYHSETVTGTISQAKAKLNELLGNMAKGTFVAPSKQTLEQHLREWLVNKNDISAKTKRDYEDRLVLDVIPALGMVKLAKLVPGLIRTLYGSLLSDRKLGPRTIRYTHAILRSALNQAVADGKIGKNPTAGATEALPKETSKTGGTALTFEETSSFLEKTKADRWGSLWRTLLTTGMRPEEALALKWTDLTDEPSLRVQRALVEEKPGAWQVRDILKTSSSNRNITIGSDLQAVLQVHRKVQLAEILKQGPKYERNEFIFATRTGHFLDIRNCRRWFKAALTASETRTIRLYDCRHTHLTHLLSRGINARAVAARSGHSDPRVLLNTYAHVLPEVAIGAANIVEGAIRNAGRNPVGIGQVAGASG